MTMLLDPHRFGGYSGTLLDDVVAWWDFEEASGGRVDSHNGHTLSPNAGTPGRRAGHTGTWALDLSGTESLILASGSASAFFNDNNSWTCSGWYYKDTSGQQMIVHLGGTNSQTHFFVDATANINIRMTANGTLINTNSATSISLNTWTHFIAQYDAGPSTGEMTIWHNNANPATVTPVTDPIYTAAQALNVGQANSGAIRWNGGIDQLIYHDRLLTSDERSELYNSGSGVTYLG